MNIIKPVNKTFRLYDRIFVEGERILVSGYKQGRYSQKEIDKHVAVINKASLVKAACNFSADVSLIVFEVEAKKLPLAFNGDQVKIYDAVKNEKDTIIEGKFFIKDEQGIAKKINDKIIITMSGRKEAKPEIIIDLLKSGKPLKGIYNDGHRIVIYGYEVKNGRLRFLVDDVGYQGDIYIESDTMEGMTRWGFKSRHGKKKYQARKLESIVYISKCRAGK